MELGNNLWVRLFALLIKPFISTGFERIQIIAVAYHFVINRLFKGFIAQVDVHGQKMYVDAAFGITLKASGSYLSEKLMTEIFVEQVKEGMTVADVGAHVGYYTLLAAKAVGDKGKVFSFEPDQSNFALLTKNIKINGYKNVVTIKKAVMDKSGSMDFYINDISSAHSVVNHKENQKTATVETVTLDEYFNGRTVGVMKIDVEGAEMSVLRGMCHTLPNKLFIEFAPSAIMKAGFTPSGFIDILYGYGFKIQVINERGQSLEPITRVLEMCRDSVYVNLFCQRGFN